MDHSISAASSGWCASVPKVAQSLRWSGGDSSEWRTLAQWDATNGRTRGELYVGSMHLASFTPTETYFLHTDQVGTVRALTTHDGTVATKCPSSPFGDSFSCTSWFPSKTLFTDYERDGETGLDHSWFRQYSPRAGRYHSPDPVLGTPEDPQSWNRYAYVRGNPVNAIDPFGLNLFGGSTWCGAEFLSCGGGTTWDGDLISGGGGFSGFADAVGPALNDHLNRIDNDLARLNGPQGSGWEAAQQPDLARDGCLVNYGTDSTWCPGNPDANKVQRPELSVDRRSFGQAPDSGPACPSGEHCFTRVHPKVDEVRVLPQKPSFLECFASPDFAVPRWARTRMPPTDSPIDRPVVELGPVGSAKGNAMGLVPDYVASLLRCLAYRASSF